MGTWPDSARAELRASSNEAQEKKEGVMSRTRMIVCGVDSSAGGRAAVRVAASLAVEFGARLVAVHVLDRLTTGSQTAERVAAAILYDEAPDAGAEARGEVGDVAERLAAVARDEAAALIVLGARSRGRSRTFLRASCAAKLANITNVPVVVVPLQHVPEEPRRGGAAIELRLTRGTL
jgi:nucleotide-binding universal stress UspA family protein